MGILVFLLWHSQVCEKCNIQTLNICINTAYNEDSLFILRNRKIWLSDPEDFNDPFDCRYKFKDEIDRVEFEEYGNRYNHEKMAELKSITENGENEGIYNAIYTKLLKDVAEDLKNTGVFCLNHHNGNILMW